MAKSAAAVHDTPMNQTQFHAAFPQLASALLEEWPALQAEPLSATQGDLDKVIGLIVETTGHTKTLVRRQLGEILQIVTAPSESAPGRGRGMAQDARAAGAAVSDAAHEALLAVEAILSEFEKKSGHVLRDLRGSVLTPTRDAIRQHWLLSLLISLGLGFIVGVLFHGLTRGK
jgi:hypothetical protein